MEQKTRDDVFLEFALLLIVTGLFVGVLVLSLLIVLSREAAIASSTSYLLASAASVTVVLALVLVLLRRLARFIRYR